MKTSCRFAVAVLVILSVLPRDAIAEAPGPMDMFVAFSRGQLQAQGFVRHEAVVAEQQMVWWEKGEGDPLILVHGVSDQAGTWFLVAPHLANDRRVLLVDLPGHGESQPSDGPLPMTVVQDGFETWLGTHATRDGAPAVVVGNSMGAWVALLAALHQPDRVARVVAVNGGGLHADTGDLDLRPADREAARRLMAALRDPSSPATPAMVLDDLVRRAPTSQVTRMFAAEADMEQHLLDERLDRIATPVDILWGESDRFLGRSYADRLVAGLPSARLTLIPRCGHLPQAECPESFRAALSALLSDPPPAPVDPEDATPPPSAPGDDP